MIEYTVMVFDNGNRYWLNKDGHLHCEHGPAFEGANGSKEWYLNGQLHRKDGPAFEGANGHKYWFLNGEQLTEVGFNKRMKKSCSGKLVEIDGVKYKLEEV